MSSATGPSALSPAVENALMIVVRDAVARHIYGGHFADWEDYPDVGEEDWLRVIKRIADLGLNMQPGTAKVDQALELLRKRGLSS